MPEEVLFEEERRRSREEIATYFRTVADRLDDGSAITFTTGADSLEMSVPANPVFEVKVERETPTGGGAGELSIEFELEWDENGGPAGEFRIE